MKLRAVVTAPGLPYIGYAHWCPGCNKEHIIVTLPGADPRGAIWSFNGNLERPSFSPGVNQPKCGYSLVDGMLHYAETARHSLAGQTVPLPDLP